MFERILNIKHPKPRWIYAVTAGCFLGELLILCDEDDQDFKFLSMPNMTIRVIPRDKFQEGLDRAIVDIVEKIPASYAKVCKKQYKKLLEQK